MDNLKWSKIIICTDADVDGFQIRTLLLAMIYRLIPSLIEAGKVYIAESPLFEISTKEGTWFAYCDKEKAQILKRLKGQNAVIHRSKGLGENDPEMMWQTTMNPETRRLIKVTPDETGETRRYFNLLLGDDLPGRKDYIAKYGHEYTDFIDVS
jgi:DNA gyrase subunit B